MTKLMLHEPHGNQRWCGPHAVSAVTGISTDDAAAIARKVGKRGAIKGMTHYEMDETLRTLGCRVTRYHTKPLTFGNWLEQRDETLRNSIVIVTAGNHYMTVLRELMVCNQTKKQKVHIASAPKLGARMKGYIVVVPPKGKVKVPKMVKAERTAKQKAAAAVAASRRKTKAKMAELGLEIEKDYPWLIVKLAKPEMYEELLTYETRDGDVNEAFYNEVFGGHSMAHDWDEVEEIVANVEITINQIRRQVENRLDS